MTSGGFPFPDPEKIFSSWWPIIIGCVVGAFYALRQWLRGAQYVEEVKLDGKTVIVTGANSGIGFAATTYFAKKGAKVIMACRNEKAAEQAIADIKLAVKKANLTFMKCDLASFKSIREFVDNFKKQEEKLDILYNNAGVIMCPQSFTEDKFEMQFGVNYLSTFLLTELLLDTLKASGPSRIVNTTASASNLGEINFDDINMTEREYSAGEAYAQSKLAVNLYSCLLSKRLEGTKVTVNLANPGIVNTEGLKHMPFKSNGFLRASFGLFVWFLMRSPADGAQTSLFLACSSTIDGVSGKLYKDCQEAKFEGNSLNEELQKKLYEVSVKWTGLEKKTN